MLLKEAEAAYKLKSYEYTQFKPSELPESIRAIYIEQEEDGKKYFGFNDGSGLLATLSHSEKDKRIILAFSATHASIYDPESKYMILTDIIQAIVPNWTYYRSAGLLKFLLKYFYSETSQFKDYEFCVIGHSLGGGLAQFSLTANVEDAENLHCKLSGYCFNAAGLSRLSMDCLGGEKLNKAKDKISNFMTYYDPVSCFLGEIGTAYKLPYVKNTSGHGIKALEKGIEKWNDQHKKKQ